MDEQTKTEFVLWLDEVSPQMINWDTRAISIVGIDKHGNVKSVYWNTSTQDRALMVHALMADNLMEMIKDNASSIVDILNGSDGDDQTR